MIARGVVAVGLMVWFGGAWAAGDDYSFAFSQARLPELARVVFGDVQKKGFVLDPEFVEDKRLVAFDVRGVSRHQVTGAFIELVEHNGYSVDLKRGVYVVRKKDRETEDDYDVLVYQPKNRSVGYIREVVARVFPKLFAQSGNTLGQPFAGQQGSVFGVHQDQQQQQQQQQQGPQQSRNGQQVQQQAQKGKDPDVLAVRGTRRQLDQLEEVLAQVDKEAGQVVIRAHVFEVQTGASDGSAFSVALNLISKGSPGGAGLTNWAYALGGGSKHFGNAVTVTNSTVDAVYSALSSDSRFKVVSSPSLRALSGEKARFSVGADVPILGAITQDKNGNPQQSVEYKPSGVILEVTPQVREGVIEVQVDQQLSDFVATATGVNNSPTLNKRQLTSTLGVQAGDVVILGGLDESKTSEDSSGLPFLPRMLRSNGSSDSKKELMLVMEVQKI